MPLAAIEGDSVYLIWLPNGSNDAEYLMFGVTGERGLRTADKHLNNVRTIINISKCLAGFVAYFLENGMMKKSS